MAFTRYDTSVEQTFSLVALIALVVLIFLLPDTAMVDGLVAVCTCTLMVVVHAHFARELKNPDCSDQPNKSKVVPHPSKHHLALTPVLEAVRVGDWDVAEAALKDWDFKAVENLMEEIITVSVEPAGVCFNAIIERCSREGHVDRGAYWLEKMLGHGVTPDATTFDPVITMLARQGEVDEAFQWLGLMRLSHVKPGIQCYKTLLCACSATDDMTRAQQLFDEMLHEEVRNTSEMQATSSPGVPVVCYNAAVQAWADAGHPRRAEYWLREAIGASCRIHPQSYSSLVASFSKAGLQVEAERWRRLSDIAARALSVRRLSDRLGAG